MKVAQIEAPCTADLTGPSTQPDPTDLIYDEIETTSVI